MATLARAIAIAAQAHERQQDRSGAPYVLHPIRVMLKMSGEAEMIAAILHDVVEDTPWTLEDLRAEGFSEEIVFAVDCLTKRDGEAYPDFVRRSALSPIALRVKLGDLEDNMDAKRLPQLSEHDLKRIKRYHQAWKALRDLL